MGKLRDKMPTIDAFIDELRELFGREYIDRAIVEGLRNGTFYAQENGHEIGKPVVHEEGVTMDQMVPWVWKNGYTWNHKGELDDRDREVGAL